MRNRVNLFLVFAIASITITLSFMQGCGCVQDGDVAVDEAEPEDDASDFGNDIYNDVDLSENSADNLNRFLAPKNLLGIQSLESVVQLDLTNPQISVDKDGKLLVSESSEELIYGNPILPVQVFKIVLPPDVDLHSVSLTIDEISIVDGPEGLDLPPAPEDLPNGAAPDAAIAWRNKDIYEKDADYPITPISIMESGRLGGYSYVTLKYYPCQYNPVQRTIHVSKKLKASIRFSTVDHLDEEIEKALESDILRDRASESFLNFRQIYKSRRGAITGYGQGYAVITANDYVNNCPEIQSFLDHKADFGGFTTHLVTEDEYGSYPGDTASKIRGWLQDNYSADNLAYALFIGDPTPEVGDVPMRITQPRVTKYKSPNSRLAPTDYYYADLTGNWDYDGDGNWGEGVGVENDMPSGYDLPSSWSARWTGQFVAAETGDHTFELHVFGTGKLYIDDLTTPILEVTESSTDVNSASASTTVSLDAGAHDMKVEMIQPDNDSLLVIHLETASRTESPLLRSECQYHNGSDWVEGLSVDYYDQPVFTDPLVTDNMDSISSFKYFWWQGEKLTGGMDSEPEVFVGRIPVYNDNYGDLASILNKTINYELQTYYPNSQRTTALLPMKPSDDSTPGYHLGEALKNDFLTPNGFTSTRVYDEDYGLTPPPEYTPCEREQVLDAWPASKGLVIWWTHGSASCGSHVLCSSDCDQLNDETPAMTFQVSCNNGKPEATNNLGYSLLKNGAVGTISASRVSWYTIGQMNFTGRKSNATMAYHFADNIMDNTSIGESFSNVRSHPLQWSNQLANAIVFNLYGDPSLTLLSYRATPTIDECLSQSGDDLIEDDNSFERQVGFANPGKYEAVCITPDQYPSYLSEIWVQFAKTAGETFRYTVFVDPDGNGPPEGAAVYSSSDQTIVTHQWLKHDVAGEVGLSPINSGSWCLAVEFITGANAVRMDEDNNFGHTYVGIPGDWNNIQNLNYNYNGAIRGVEYHCDEWATTTTTTTTTSTSTTTSTTTTTQAPTTTTTQAPTTTTTQAPTTTTTQAPTTTTTQAPTTTTTQAPTTTTTQAPTTTTTQAPTTTTTQVPTTTTTQVPTTTTTQAPTTTTTQAPTTTTTQAPTTTTTQAPTTTTTQAPTTTTTQMPTTTTTQAPTTTTTQAPTTTTTQAPTTTTTQAPTTTTTQAPTTTTTQAPTTTTTQAPTTTTTQAPTTTTTQAPTTTTTQAPTTTTTQAPTTTTTQAPTTTTTQEPTTTTTVATTSTTTTTIPENVLFDESTASADLTDNYCDTLVTDDVINITEDYSILDVDVGILVDHTYRGDLLILLESPEGTVVTLYNDRATEFGDSADNLYGTFDQESLNIPCNGFDDLDPSYDNRDFAPYDSDELVLSLDGFNGEYSQGDWILSICDRKDGDTGELISWALWITYDPDVTTTTTIPATTTTTTIPGDDDVDDDVDDDLNDDINDDIDDDVDDDLNDDLNDDINDDEDNDFVNDDSDDDYEDLRSGSDDEEDSGGCCG